MVNVCLATHSVASLRTPCGQPQPLRFWKAAGAGSQPDLGAAWCCVWPVLPYTCNGRRKFGEHLSMRRLLARFTCSVHCATARTRETLLAKFVGMLGLLISRIFLEPSAMLACALAKQGGSCCMDIDGTACGQRYPGFCAGLSSRSAWLFASCRAYAPHPRVKLRRMVPSCMIATGRGEKKADFVSACTAIAQVATQQAGARLPRHRLSRSGHGPSGQPESARRSS